MESDEELQKAARGVKFESAADGEDADEKGSAYRSPRSGSDGSGSEGLRRGSVRGLDWNEGNGDKKMSKAQRRNTKVFNFREDIQ